MDDIKTVNALLYRPLKEGKKYDKYFPNVGCKPTFLGNGDTYKTINEMKKIALKYRSQTSKISKLLTGPTIKATCDNIYQFLYDHLQYSADGSDQYLKSPACAWKTRKQGIDCKSYSVFASTILLNLGIPHVIRKVIQPSSPGRWSHVYVIVKHKGKELIIDSTTHDNKEVHYVQKNDLIMPNLAHYGLNAPSQQSFIGTSKTQLAVLNFVHLFLPKLEQQGVSKNTIESIKNEVKDYVDRGIDPKIELSQSYIAIQGKIYHYGAGLNGPSGLGFWSDVVKVFGGKKSTKTSKGGNNKGGQSGTIIKGISDVFSNLFDGMFDGSPVEAFTIHANNLMNNAFPAIKNQYRNDAAKALTELSRITNYVLSLYDFMLRDCSSSCEKNQSGKNIAMQALSKLDQIVSQLQRDTVFETDVITETIPLRYYQRYGVGHTAKTTFPSSYTKYTYVSGKNTVSQGSGSGFPNTSFGGNNQLPQTSNNDGLMTTAKVAGGLFLLYLGAKKMNFI